MDTTVINKEEEEKIKEEIIKVEEKKEIKKARLKLVASEEWSIEDIVKRCPPAGWDELFRDVNSPYYVMDEIVDVSEILESEERTVGRFFPLKRNIFKAFDMTPLNNVKVVLIGMDPYPTLLSNGTCRAQGLSFSVSPNDVVPTSLNNMYTELRNTVQGFSTPCHGDISLWAKRGVLLLNACLTVQNGVSGSHGKIWLGFLSKVLALLASQRPHAVYILLGRDAQKLEKMIGDKSIKIMATHPSGKSAYGKGGKKGYTSNNNNSSSSSSSSSSALILNKDEKKALAKKGSPSNTSQNSPPRGGAPFFGSNIFNLANEALKKHNIPPVDWTLPLSMDEEN